MTALSTRPLGKTGLQVFPVALGGGPFGAPHLHDDDVRAIVERARAFGVNLVDTAPSYGESEARLGRVLQGANAGFQISTKLGYAVPGVPDWTAACITLGIEKARQTLQRDVIDIVFLHSCPAAVLDDNALCAALQEAKAQGRVRAIGYAGDGAGLDAALAKDFFDVVQVSVSVVDQEALAKLARPHVEGLFVLAKRALLSGALTNFDANRADHRTLAARFDTLAPFPNDAEAPAKALRFALHAPAVDAVLVGTARAAHLESLLQAAAAGPLPESLCDLIRARYDAPDARFPGLI